MVRFLRLSACVLLAGALVSGAAPKERVRPDYRRAARDGVDALHAWYEPEKGLWKSTGWWNAANSLGLVIRYTAVTHDARFRADIANTFDRNSAGRFLNRYYDDEGWWALTWLDAYDLTHDHKYLTASRAIFDDMKDGWDDHCGGGIWWSKARKYKNAIANSLFLTLAARLHAHVGGDRGPGSYLDWANRSWSWFRDSGMINPKSTVNDGLNSGCANNGGTEWTYNQGSLIAGLVALHAATHDRALLDGADRIADAAIKALTAANGILREPCEADDRCGGDGPQFKGIFARSLALLYRVTKRPEHRRFLLANADSIVAHDRDDSGHFGLRWAGPFDRADAARQTSALCVIVEAAACEPAASSLGSQDDSR